MKNKLEKIIQEAISDNDHHHVGYYGRQIMQLITEAIPEKWDKEYLDDYQDGFNQCIADIKKNLNENKE